MEEAGPCHGCDPNMSELRPRVKRGQRTPPGGHRGGRGQARMQGRVLDLRSTGGRNGRKQMEEDRQSSTRSVGCECEG
eukprot:scaffold1401_cov330-Pavlova_lutheri.AAC.69